MRGENRKWQIGLLMAGMALALYGCTKETRASETEAEASPVEIAAESGQQDENDAQIQTLPVIYSFDNSSRVQESQSGVFTGDWDRDGTDDTLTIQTEEQEGSEMIQRLELTLSGCAEAYVMDVICCEL